MASTAEYFIYALGGGHGHARRGWLLQRALREQGVTSILAVRPGAGRLWPQAAGPRVEAEHFFSPALDELRRHPPAQIIVDTFPGGWRGELDQQALRTFKRTVWLARHSKVLPTRVPVYDRVLAPYPPDHCEWGGRLEGAHPMGYVIDGTHLHLERDEDTFALLDSEGRCDERLLSILDRLAKMAGLRFEWHRSLARAITARKFLVVGAGYHTFYELLGKDLDARFLPVHKRHDDQFSRAARFHRALIHLDEVLPWLVAPADHVVVDTRADWTGLMRQLQE